LSKPELSQSLQVLTGVQRAAQGVNQGFLNFGYSASSQGFVSGIKSEHSWMVDPENILPGGSDAFAFVIIRQLKLRVGVASWISDT